MSSALPPTAPLDIPLRSPLGFASLSFFLATGVIETLFVGMGMLLVSSLPAGSAETFRFSERMGMVLLVGQGLHIVGILCGIAGMLRKGQGRTLAMLGVLTNGTILSLFLFT